MSKQCGKCKFSDYDYDFEDCLYEYCTEHHWEEFESEDECPFFKKAKNIAHVEQDTICDNCNALDECIGDGSVVDITTIFDERSHYIGSALDCRLFKEKHGV